MPTSDQAILMPLSMSLFGSLLPKCLKTLVSIFSLLIIDFIIFLPYFSFLIFIVWTLFNFHAWGLTLEWVGPLCCCAPSKYHSKPGKRASFGFDEKTNRQKGKLMKRQNVEKAKWRNDKRTWRQKEKPKMQIFGWHNHLQIFESHWCWAVVHLIGSFPKGSIVIIVNLLMPTILITDYKSGPWSLLLVSSTVFLKDHLYHYHLHD